MDDEDIVRNITGVMIRSLGHEVELAENGSEAIELVGRFLREEDKVAGPAKRLEKEAREIISELLDTASSANKVGMSAKRQGKEYQNEK